MVDASALQSALEKLNKREGEIFELEQKLAVSTKACEDDKIKSGKLKMLQEKLAVSNQIIVDKDDELTACEDSRKKLLDELDLALNQLAEQEKQLATLSVVKEEKVALQASFDQYVKNCESAFESREKESKSRIDRLKSTIDTLNEESMSMKETILEKDDEQKMSAKKLKNVAQMWKKEREESREKMKNATKLVARLRQERSALNTLNDELREGYSISKSQVENLTETFEDRVNNLEEQLQTKQRALENMTNSESDARTKLNDLKSKSAQKIHDLEQHLQTKQRELEDAIHAENNACTKLHDVKSESTKKVHHLEQQLRKNEEIHSEEKELLLTQLSQAKKIQVNLEEKVAELVAERDQARVDENFVAQIASNVAQSASNVAQSASNVAQIDAADDVCEHEESLIQSVGDNLSIVDEQQDLADDEISEKEESEAEDKRYV